MNRREKIEILFEKLTRWLYLNPVKTLLSALIIIGFLVSQVPSLTIDTTSEALLRKDDPSLLEYNHFRDQFGRAELIIIAIESSEVFEYDFFIDLNSSILSVRSLPRRNAVFSDNFLPR